MESGDPWVGRILRGRQWLENCPPGMLLSPLHLYVAPLGLRHHSHCPSCFNLPIMLPLVTCLWISKLSVRKKSVPPDTFGCGWGKSSMFHAKHIVNCWECHEGGSFISVISSCLQNEQMTHIYRTHSQEPCPKLILILKSCVFLCMEGGYKEGGKQRRRAGVRGGGEEGRLRGRGLVLWCVNRVPVLGCGEASPSPPAPPFLLALALPPSLCPLLPLPFPSLLLFPLPFLFLSLSLSPQSISFYFFLPVVRGVFRLCFLLGWLQTRPWKRQSAV